MELDQVYTNAVASKGIKVQSLCTSSYHSSSIERDQKFKEIENKIYDQLHNVVQTLFKDEDPTQYNTPAHVDIAHVSYEQALRELNDSKK